ncbi:hypothetical protein [Acinetobacter baumannii]
MPNVSLMYGVSLAWPLHLASAWSYHHDSFQLIGKSSTTIQQDLNLRSLGFQVARTPQKTSDQLIYTILRPLSIPIPMVSNVDMRGGSVPIQSGNLSGNSYDLNFNCKVIFKLKNDIAESIQYEGKAC